MEINLDKNNDLEKHNILESGLINFQAFMKNIINKSSFISQNPQTQEIFLKKYKENDEEIDSLMNRIKEFKYSKDRIRDKKITNQSKKYRYGDLIHKFNKITEKPEKKKPKAILNESDYSDDSIDYGLVNIRPDKNHDDETLKKLRKCIKSKNKEFDGKLREILKNDIESILRKIDDLGIKN